MKNQRFIILLAGALFSAQLSAQTDTIVPSVKQPNLVGWYIGMGASYPLTGIATFALLRRNGWGGNLTLSMKNFDAENKPANYHSGSLIGKDDKVNDVLYCTTIRIVKEFRKNSDNSMFPGLEIGPSLVRFSIADNFVARRGIQLFSPNYTYKRYSNRTIGLSVRAKISIFLLHGARMEVGASANINSLRSYFGVDLLGTLGSFPD